MSTAEVDVDAGEDHEQATGDAVAQQRNDPGAHFRDRRDRQLRSTRREIVKAAVQRGHEVIEARDREALVGVIVDRLYPALELSRATAESYHEAIDAEATLFWDWLVVAPFVRQPEQAREWPFGDLTRLFLSLHSAAVAEGHVAGNSDRWIPAVEYQRVVAMRGFKPTTHTPDLEELIDRGADAEPKATLMTGGQGSGKSTGSDTLVEDRLAQGNKVIDLVDFHKSENCVYDIPQQQETLRSIRQQYGLPVDFEGRDPPRVEVLAPLTHGLEFTKVPYDTENERHIVRPLTIPASELTYRQLVMLLPHTTRTQENYLKSAHEKLSNSGKDWTLRDMAETVRWQTNAGEKVADRIELALETVQNKGFIRDSQSQWLLDWDDLMSDVSTVTAFTVHMMREKADKMVVMSYLLDCIYTQRDRLIRERRLADFPPMTLVMRELHKICPRQKSEQDAENTIEGYMIDTMSDLIALMRHVKMDIIADTQKFHQQLSPTVSGLFHRVYAYGGQKPDIKTVFRTRVDDTGPATAVAQYDTGMAALVSQNGYTMPLKMMPPECHHLDTTRDGDGFSARCAFLEHEELVDSPWSAEIPDRLSFDRRASAETLDTPVSRFVEDLLVKTTDEDNFVFKVDVTAVYEAWATKNGETVKGHNAVNEDLKKVLGTWGQDSDRYLTYPDTGTAGSGRKPAHSCVRWNDEGQDLLERVARADGGLQDASEPVDAD